VTPYTEYWATWRSESTVAADDVQDEDEVSEYCAVMARHHRETGDPTTAAKFELLGGRHHERAAKIAALLPPS
jgi:hypothetical protein